MHKDYLKLLNFINTIKDADKDSVYGLSIVLLKSIYGDNLLNTRTVDKEELLLSLTYILRSLETDCDMKIKIVVKNKNKNIFKIN